MVHVYRKIVAMFMISILVATDLLTVLLGLNSVRAANLSTSNSGTKYSNSYSASFNTDNLPNYRRLLSITTNNGTVTYNESGNKVNFTASGGSGWTDYSEVTGGYYTPSDSFFVSGQSSSSYNSGGYSGSLSRYVSSGSPADSFTASDSCSHSWTVTYNENGHIASSSQGSGCPGSMSYNSGGYSGTLGRTGDSGYYCPGASTPYDSCSAYASASYSGTVYKPDTRVYKYEGYVYKPAVDTRTYAYKYSYNVTLNYETHEAPVIHTAVATRLSAPSKIVSVSGLVNDANGDEAILSYEIKNSSGTIVRTVNDFARTTNDYSFTADLSDLPTGDYTAVIKGVDDYGYTSVNKISNSFNIDNTAPSIVYSTIPSLTESDVLITTSFSDANVITSREVNLVDSSDNITRSTVNPTDNSNNTIVKNNGTYYLDTSAIDSYLNNNQSTKSNTFTISRPPAPNSSSLGKINLNRFQEVSTINLETLFNPYEWEGVNDITYRLVSENENVVTAQEKIIDGNRHLLITGIKQGVTNIKIYATNTSGKESSEITLPIEVVNREVTTHVENDYPVVTDIDNSTGLIIEGTVHDLDKDVIKVKTTLNDTIKTNTTIETINLEELNVVQAPWETAMPILDLKTGVYYDKLNVNTNDGQGSANIVEQRNAPIVLVKDAARYNTLVEKYSNDIGGVDIFSWNADNHNALFIAYEQMQLTESDTTNIEQIRTNYLLLRDGELNGVTTNHLTDGTVKEEFYAELSDFAFKWLQNNFSEATVLDYEIVSKNLIVRDDVNSHLNHLGQKHLNDLDEEFTKIELQRVYDKANETYDAIVENKVDTWMSEFKAKYSFNSGEELAAALDIYIEDGMLNALHENPKDIKIQTLNEYFKEELGNELEVVDSNYTHYVTYLNDIVNLQGKPTVQTVLDMTEVVNSINKDYNNFLTNPSDDTLTPLLDSIDKLIADTPYQISWKNSQKRLEFIDFVFNIENKEKEAYEYFGITDVSENPIEKYVSYIHTYMNDEIENMNENNPVIQNHFEIKEDILYISDDMNFEEDDVQKVINLVNNLRAYEKDEATLEEIEETMIPFGEEQLIHIIANSEKGQQIWDKVNNQTRVANITINELDRVSVVNLISDNLSDYRKNLILYRQSILTELWTLADVQLVVDSTNSFIKGKKEPSTDTIALAHAGNDLLNKNGSKVTPLYTILEKELEQIAVNYIVAQVNSNKEAVFQDIIHTNVTGFHEDPEHKEDYVLTLEDEIRLLGPVDAAKLNKAKVQNLVSTFTKDFLTVYHSFVDDISNTDKLTALLNSITGLDSAGLTTIYEKYEEIASVKILKHLFMKPDVNRQGIYSLIGLDYYDRFNIDLYAEFLPHYPQDILNHGYEGTFTIPLLQDAIYAIEEYAGMIGLVSEAIENNTIHNDEVLQQLFDSRDYILDTILSGKLAEVLVGDMTSIILKNMNNTDFEITTIELLDLIEIENLNSNIETMYRDSLNKYKIDVQEDLSLSDLQLIVDLMNSIHTLSNQPVVGDGSITTEDITSTLENINNVADGSLKNSAIELVEQVSVLYVHENSLIDNLNIQDLINAQLDDLSLEETDHQLYFDYLEDTVRDLEDDVKLTSEQAQNAIDSINTMNQVFEDYEASVTRGTLDVVIDFVNALAAGELKNTLLDKKVIAIVDFFNNTNRSEEITDTNLYGQIAANALEENTTSYADKLPAYITENENTLTQDEIKAYVDAVNSNEVIKELLVSLVDATFDEAATIFEGISSNLEVVHNLNDGTVETELLEDVIVDFINENTTYSHNELLEFLKVTSLIPENETRYNEAINIYKNDLDGNYIDVPELQVVTDVMNEIIILENKPNISEGALTTEDFNSIIETVNSIEDGALKDSLNDLVSNELLSFITDNAPLENIRIQDLLNLGIKHISEEPSIQEQYLKYITDFVNNTVNEDNPLTVESLQSTVETVNKIEGIYNQYNDEPIRSSLDGIITFLEDVIDGVLKTELVDNLKNNILNYINDVNRTEEIIDEILYKELGANVDVDNNEVYREKLPQYLFENGNVLSEQEVLDFIDAINSSLFIDELLENIKNAETEGDRNTFIDDIVNHANILSKLTDGNLKDELFEDKFLEYINNNLPNIPYELIGSVIDTPLEPSLEDEYNVVLDLYQDDLPEFALNWNNIEEIINVINKINNLATTPNTGEGALVTEDFNEALQAIEEIQSGQAKNDLKNDFMEELLEYIKESLIEDKITLDDFENADIENISEKEINQEEYFAYLKDVIDNLGEDDLTQNSLQKVVDAVENFHAAEGVFADDKERGNLDAIKNIIDNVEDGEYKNKLINEYKDDILEYVNETDSLTTDDTDLLKDLGIPVTEGNEDSYLENILNYIKDKGEIEVDDLTLIVDASDSQNKIQDLLAELPEIPTLEEVEELAGKILDDMKKIHDLEDGIAKEAILQNVLEVILDITNDDFNNLNTDIAKILGADNFNEVKEPLYVEDLNKLQTELERDLTATEIAKVINVVNKIEEILVEDKFPLITDKKEALSDLKKIIDSLPESDLKDEYLEQHKSELEEIILGNPDLIENADLKVIGIDNGNDDLLGDYKQFIGDVQEGELNLELLQKTITLTNLLEKVKLDLLEVDILALKAEIETLEEGNYKTSLLNLQSLFAEIKKYENNTTLQYFLTTQLFKKFETVSTKFKPVEISNSFGVYFATGSIEINSKPLTIDVENIVEETALYAYDMIRANNERLILPAINSEETATEMWDKIDSLLTAGEYEIRLLHDDTEKIFINLISLTPDDIQLHWFTNIGLPIEEKHIPYIIEDVNSTLTTQDDLFFTILTKEQIEHIHNFVENADVIESGASYGPTIDAFFALNDEVKSPWEKEKFNSLKNIVDKLKRDSETTLKELSIGASASATSPIKLVKPSEVNFNNNYNVIIEHQKATTTNVTPYKKELATFKGEDDLFHFEVGDGIQVAVKENSNFVKGYDTEETIIDMKVSVDDTTPEEGIVFGIGIDLVDYESGDYVTVNDFQSYTNIEIPNDIHGLSDKRAYLVKEGANGSKTYAAVPHVIKGDKVVVKTRDAGEFIIKEANDIYFGDISNTFSKGAINELAKRSIVAGTKPEIFNPNTNITRAEFAVMLSRGLGLKSSSNKSHFTDVRGKWHEGGVQALYEAGLIAGINSKEFGANDLLTRQDAMVILLRAAKFVDADKLPENVQTNEKGFRDYEKTSNYAKSSLDTMVKLGVINGRTANTVVPKGNLTRAEMAAILQSTLRKVDLM